jgi:C_GCAxxG_C_C family probable redox protein
MRGDSMDRSQKAVEIFSKNFNCAQAVLSVFAEEGGLEKDKALLITSCFGGGMRCGEACGAVTGALMSIGLQYGYTSVEDAKDRMRSNGLACDFEVKFREKHGTIVCKELLGYDLSKPDDMTKLIELGYFSSRCPEYVADAVTITEEVLNKQQIS